MMLERFGKHCHIRKSGQICDFPDRILIGQQIFEGIFINDNISNLTHIIGGVVGAATGYALNKRKR